MNDLDRRIAIEIMGEEEPKALRPSQDEIDRGMAVLSLHQISLKRNWEAYCIYANGDIPEWHPMPFSSSLEEALRAVDKLLAELSEKTGRNLDLSMVYEPNTLEPFHTYCHFRHGYGNTLPEAICNLLLALKEKQ